VAFLLYNTGMSEINKLVERVKLATKYQANKRTLKETITAELHLPFNGGLFMLSPALLAFVSTWPDPTLFIEDAYENPIEVNRDEFLVVARERYHAAMNSWNHQSQEIKRARKV
jgi:hypothetical protein